MRRAASGIDGYANSSSDRFAPTSTRLELLTSGFVARQVILASKLGVNLIIVTPNPLTYLLMPFVELVRRVYCRALRINPPDR